jgi:hypothetical protein
VLRIARTVADLDGSHLVALPHVAEALRYRPATRPPRPAAVNTGSHPAELRSQHADVPARA